MNYSLEEFEKMKTKVLKYILYKKRTEKEIRQKFIKEDEKTLEDVIEYLKEAKYISDEEYISRAVNEYIALKNLSITEIKYKLYTKGIEKDLIEQYIDNHNEELLEYEKNSLKNIISKKSNSEEKELIEFLLKKGFKRDTIKEVLDERFNENE